MQADASAFQFSLRSVLIVTALIAIFCGLLLGGWYFTAFVHVVIVSVAMMFRDLILERHSRRFAIGLLLAAGAYLAANALIFLIVIAEDVSAILNAWYVVAVLLGAPALSMLAAISGAVLVRTVDWVGVVGFLLWICWVEFAHFWFVAHYAAYMSI